MDHAETDGAKTGPSERRNDGRRFGNSRVIDPRSEVQQVYSYTGTQGDVETAVYYYRHRMFSAQLGRFASRDPVGYEGETENLHEYGRGTPVLFTDSRGLFCGCDPGYMGIGLMGDQIKAKERERQRARAKEICAKVDICSETCLQKRCTPSSCENSLTDFIRAVEETWIFGLECWFGRELYFGPNTCSRWVLDLNNRLPEDFIRGPCILHANLQEHDIICNAGATRVHWTFRVRLCDGTEINADNGGWGGKDHLWGTFAH